jgi:acyl carrier protein
MKDKIYEILGNTFEIDPNNISENLTQNDIDNWDSFRHLQLIVDLENEFGISFDNEELVSLIDIKTIVNFVYKKTKINK